MQAIGKNLNKVTTTYDWLVRAEGGLDRLYDIKRSGPARKLAVEQLAELREDLIAGPQEHGFESGLWTRSMSSRCA